MQHAATVERNLHGIHMQDVGTWELAGKKETTTSARCFHEIFKRFAFG